MHNSHILINLEFLAYSFFVLFPWIALHDFLFTIVDLCFFFGNNFLDFHLMLFSLISLIRVVGCFVAIVRGQV